MTLLEHTAEELCVVDLPARDRADCIVRLCDHLHALGRIEDPEAITESLLAREHIESTAIGGGVAIPHVRSPQVQGALVCVARLASPIDFQALDREPVDLVFLLLGARELPGQHLRVLAQVSRLLRNHGLLDELRSAESSSQSYAALREAEAAL